MVVGASEVLAGRQGARCVETCVWGSKRGLVVRKGVRGVQNGIRGFENESGLLKKGSGEWKWALVGQYGVVGFENRSG